MKQIITQFNPRAPHETLLVVDGSLGRNAVDQALAWRKHVGVSGLAITKMDGTARGYVFLHLGINVFPYEVCMRYTLYLEHFGFHPLCGWRGFLRL